MSWRRSACAHVFSREGEEKLESYQRDERTRPPAIDEDALLVGQVEDTVEHAYRPSPPELLTGLLTRLSSCTFSSPLSAGALSFTAPGRLLRDASMRNLVINTLVGASRGCARPAPALAPGAGACASWAASRISTFWK